MSTLDIMRKVRKAEDEADGIRKAASAEAREILKAVEGATAQDERQAAQDVRAKVMAFHREEDVKVDAQIAKALGDERDALATQREHARSRVVAAANQIYERILQHGDH